MGAIRPRLGDLYLSPGKDSRSETNSAYALLRSRSPPIFARSDYHSCLIVSSKHQEDSNVLEVVEARTAYG